MKYVIIKYKNFIKTQEGMIVIKAKKIFSLIVGVVLLVVSMFSSPMTVLGEMDDGYVDFHPGAGMSTKVEADCNNGQSFTQNVSTYESLNKPTLAGAIFKGWYLDEALTKPAKGEATADKVWAKWESVVCGYDDPNASIFKNSKATWEIREHIGLLNTSAIYCKELNNNNLWPDHLTFYNPDGSEFKTIAGHKYSLSLYVKPDDWSKVDWNSKIAIRYNAGSSAYDENSDNDVYPSVYRDSDGKPARSVFKAIHDNAVEAGRADNDSWVLISFTFVSQNSTPVQIMFNLMGSTFAVDEIKIVDLTARKNITFGDIVVSGYAGDEITYPNATGNMNVVGWKIADGNEFTDKIFTKDLIITPDYRSIAITNSDVNGGTLNFKLRFEGVNFKMNSSDVAKDDQGRVIVKQIGIGSILYPVVRVGVRVNGAEYSGSSVKYSAAENNLLEVTVKNSTSNYSAEYKDIEGYIQYTDAFGKTKTITSKLSNNDIGARQGVGLSYNAAAGFGRGATIGYTDPTGKYTLTWYDEFDSDEWDSEKWGFGTQFAVRTNSTIYEKANDDELTYKSGGKLVLKSKYDAKNGVCLGVRAQPKYKFYHGYIETRIKVSKEYLSGTAFWLNNAGVFDDDPVKPTDESPATSPEIDVVEVFDSVNDIYGITFHMWGIKNGVQEHRQLGGGAVNINEAVEGTNRICFTKYRDAEGYITVGFERTKDTMNFYIHEANGTRKLLYTVTYNELKAISWGGTATEKLSLFLNPEFLIFGQGVYDSTDVANFKGAVSYVDYVRIYE